MQQDECKGCAINRVCNHIYKCPKNLTEIRVNSEIYKCPCKTCLIKGICNEPCEDFVNFEKIIKDYK